VTLENTHHVPQHSKRHQIVDTALMLEQQVHEPAPAGDLDRKEQIGLTAGELAVDVTSRLENQRRKIDASEDRRRQHRAKLRRGVFDPRKRHTKQRVVRVVRVGRS
jgi:hypothetical protein